MDPIRLNQTTTCYGCKKENARWSLTVGRNLSSSDGVGTAGSLKPREPSQTKSDPSQTKSDPEYVILFCPVCDRITPEDLEVTDMRIIVLPGSLTGPGVHLGFMGAAQYREKMGPNRPFRQRDSKTMRRWYKMDGTEYTGN